MRTLKATQPPDSLIGQAARVAAGVGNCGPFASEPGTIRAAFVWKPTAVRIAAGDDEAVQNSSEPSPLTHCTTWKWPVPSIVVTSGPSELRNVIALPRK